MSRRPKLVKQKPSICDDTDYNFPEPTATSTPKNDPALRSSDSRVQLLRKQSSLNEELMAESRLREKERIKKRIHKQMSLNESFLCRSLFTKRLQVIKEGFTTKLKTSTGITKNGIVKIMQNIKGANPHHQCQQQQQGHNPQGPNGKYGPHEQSPYGHCYANVNYNGNGTMLFRKNSMTNGNDKLVGLATACSLDDSKPRRHSRESGSGMYFYELMSHFPGSLGRFVSFFRIFFFYKSDFQSCYGK